MRVRVTGLLVAIVSFALVAATAFAGDDTAKQDKGKKRAAGEKVEMKDIPSAVTDAAKKELPNANWTSAEKVSAKKKGTMFSLEGKDGKYQVTAMFSTSGELQRLTKSVELKKKKNA